jgi:hypothetical protein
MAVLAVPTLALGLFFEQFKGLAVQAMALMTTGM